MYNLPAQSLDPEFCAYMQKVLAIPMLQEEEEKSLIERWCEKKDIWAAQKLIESYLRLVTKIVVKFKSYGLPMMDMVSEGNIGLMRAIKNFKPELGCKIATYAVWWIKAAIHEYIVKSWSIVKIGTTAVQRKLFFNLRKLRNSISNSEKNLTDNQVISQVAKTLDVKESQVRDMDCVLCGHDISLNAPVAQDNTKEMHETICNKEPSQEIALIDMQEENIKKKLLAQAIDSLDERHKKILLLRTGANVSTLKDLSQMFEISQERVRQIQARAMEKVKQYVLKHSKAFGIKVA